MRKSIIIVLSILFLIISSNVTMAQNSDGSGNTNIAIATGGNATANVDNNANAGPISIEIGKNNRKKHGYGRK